MSRKLMLIGIVVIFILSCTKVKVTDLEGKTAPLRFLLCMMFFHSDHRSISSPSLLMRE